MVENKICRVCGTQLNNENWRPVDQKYQANICKTCNNKRHYSWKKENPEKVKAQWTRQNRKRGSRPFNENRECSSFLGVHIAEHVLSRVFKDVKRMPINNPGYDFTCNHGKKIDVKSSCILKQGGWMFNINHNIVADYFLCIAFDNREALTPLYTWLIPKNVVNHHKCVGICYGTITKWDEYNLDIAKILTCCDELRTRGGFSQHNPDEV